MSFLYKHNYSRIAVKPLAEEDRRTRDVVGNVVKTSEVLSERFEPDNSQKNTEKDENSDDRRSEEFRRTRDVAVNVVEASKSKSFIHIFYTSVSGRIVSKSSITPTPIPIPERDYIRSPSWKKYEKHPREDDDIIDDTSTTFSAKSLFLRNSTGLQSTSLNEFLSDVSTTLPTPLRNFPDLRSYKFSSISDKN